ncbi:hypothetical protein N7490_009605 [Penicillium lividum]|nr:hypothetical protein N7490_009605 [Penicillium lividum]
MSHSEWLLNEYFWPSNGIQEDSTTSVNENGRFTPALQQSESLPTTCDQHFHNLSTSSSNAPSDQTDMPLETTRRNPIRIFDVNGHPCTALHYWDPISLSWHQVLPNLPHSFANAHTNSWDHGASVDSRFNEPYGATIPMRQMMHHNQSLGSGYNISTAMQATPSNVRFVIPEQSWERNNLLLDATLPLVQTPWLDVTKTPLTRPQLEYSNLQDPNPLANAMYEAVPLEEMAYCETSFHQPREHTYNLTPHIEPYSVDTRSTIQEPTWGDSRVMTIEVKPPSGGIPSNRTDVQSRETFKCDWKDCRYTKTFRRKAGLMRHIDTQHISRGAYQCPIPACGSRHNREDNLQVHLRTVHGSRPSRS